MTETSDTCCSSNCTSSSSLSSRGHRSVEFSCIRIREFERIAGDNPGISDYGPPLSIGWRFAEQDDIPVDDFEERRDRDRRYSHDHPLERLNGKTRRNILQFGFKVETKEIEDMIQVVERVKKQRNNSNKPSLLERMSRTGRHAKRRTFSA